MSVQFEFSATIIKLQNPDRDNSEPNRHFQAKRRSAGGEFFVYKKGIKTKAFRLVFSELRQVEKNLLLAFFDGVQASFSQFAYTDHKGVTRTARFLDDTLDFTERDDKVTSSGTYQPSGSGQAYPTTLRGDGIWQVEFELEVEVPA